MIRAVIFDFFGVLVTEGFKRFCDEYFPDDVVKRRQAIDLVTAHDRGVLSAAGYIDGLAALAGVSRSVISEHMGANQPNAPLLKYIGERLKPRYKIGVLSNSGDNYLSQILKPGDAELFNDIVLSYRHGMVKPQAEIFEFAAERLGVRPEECVFIDDSSSHCAGASRAGMTAILYKDFPDFQKQIKKVLSADADN